jgi:hypothetical protein
VDDQPGRLVDDDQVVVLEQDHERHRLGLGDQRRGRPHPHDDLVAGAQLDARLGCRRAADEDVALVDQALDLRAAQLGQPRGDERVEPLGDRRVAGLDAEAMLYQILDFTCPLDFTRTSTIARS